jgi:hypothetical protein
MFDVSWVSVVLYPYLALLPRRCFLFLSLIQEHAHLIWILEKKKITHELRETEWHLSRE